jgi:hypothetical protein
MPIGNEFYYRKYAEILLDRPAADTTELDAMQLKLQCAGFVCSAKGYGKQFTQTCVPTSFNLLNPALIDSYSCSPFTGDTGTNPSLLRKI